MPGPDKVTPLSNWLFCSSLRPREKSEGGLWIPKDWDKDVMSEGVAEIVKVGPDVKGLEPGEKIIYRGFLRYAQRVEELFGGCKPSDYFLLSADDVLAVIEGTGGTIGFHDEFVL